MGEERALSLLEQARIPLLREYIARRFPDLVPSVRALARAKGPAVQGDVLRGVQASLKGRRTGWNLPPDSGRWAWPERRS